MTVADRDGKRGTAEMLRIRFEFRDGMTGDEWRERECICQSVEQCIEFYGLGTDCEYRIVSVEKV